MRLLVYPTSLLLLAKFLMPATSAFATSDSQVEVKLEGPPGILRMGDSPAFSGTVSNKGSKPIQGLVVYLSLVSLKPGAEEPVDLEDWSATRTIRIPRLLPGEISTHDWNIRLIDAGDYGVALTVIDLSEQKPVVSQLVRFRIEPKPMLKSERILPVAIGEPLLVLVILAAIKFSGGGMNRNRN